jgi:hypothetical protein
MSSENKQIYIPSVSIKGAFIEEVGGGPEKIHILEKRSKHLFLVKTLTTWKTTIIPGSTLPEL